MVTAMDHAVGMVIKALKRNNMYKKTLILFLSDVSSFVRTVVLIYLTAQDEQTGETENGAVSKCCRISYQSYLLIYSLTTGSLK